MSKENVGLGAVDASGKSSKVDINRRALTMNTNNEDSDNGNNELNDASSVIGSGLRRRKGKIISCAKETIENGKLRWRGEIENLLNEFITLQAFKPILGSS